MQKPDNFYLVLGLTRAASDMDIAQAYRAGVQKMQALSGTDPAHIAQRLQQMELAYETLLNPEKKKKHDEAIAWFDTQQRLENERALERTLRLKEEEKAAKEAEARAQVLAQDLAKEAARQAQADAKRQEEEARVRAEAEARFRQLRQERNDFGETLPQDPDTQQTTGQAEGATAPPPPTSSKAIGNATIAASVAAVAVLFGLLLNLRPGAPSQPKPPAPVAQVPAQAPATAKDTAIVTAAPQPAAQPVAAAPAKTRIDDKDPSLEAQQYQKALRDMEAAHPELNPRSAAYRADLMAFVTSRMQVHTKAGYPKPKALAIAVRDLETQDATHHAIEKLKSQKDKSEPEAAPAPDKGGHSGFDPKCRWVNAQEWSCK